jgi:hypothetical protein
VIAAVAITLAGAAGAGAFGTWVVRRDHEADGVYADEWLHRLATHPFRGLFVGSGRVVVGEPLTGMGPSVPVTAVPVPDVPALPVGDICSGHLIRHRDGHDTCHQGLAECHPGITRHRHVGRPERCDSQSHGCGECLVAVGGAP